MRHWIISAILALAGFAGPALAQNSAGPVGGQGSADPALEVLDVTYYLSKNADVRETYGNNQLWAHHHWLTQGIRECRQPSRDFSLLDYLARYPDLTAAFGNDCTAAMQHWLTYGKKEGRSAAPNPQRQYSLGMQYGGGVIFYLDASGNHGLIAAPRDTYDNQSSSRSKTYWLDVKDCPVSFEKFYCVERLMVRTKATATGIGAGANNTEIILKAQGRRARAAILARTSRHGGFSDWFLPSIDELAELFKRRALVGGLDTPTQVGQFTSNARYCTSSEVNLSESWSYLFTNQEPDGGYPAPHPKIALCSVRVIRAF